MFERSLPPRAEPDLGAIDFGAAAERLRGVVRETALVPFPTSDSRIELRLKLECLQVTGAFKARGAWNTIAQLDEAQRKRGVVTTSSGNHGKALAWAAERAGVHATIVMPADAYPNKIEACRELGAEVLLAPTRVEAEALGARLAAEGRTFVHPYDALRTIEGAGTVGAEIAVQWPEVDVVLVPVGGGGLLAGTALALRRTLGSGLRIVGVEPAGAPTMTAGLAAGRPVVLDAITTRVQGLCPLNAGELNVAIARTTVDRVLTLEDAPIFAAQARLVREGGWTVEPAGAATLAAVEVGSLPEEWLTERSAERPLRVAAVVSGGNPDPRQLEALR